MEKSDKKDPATSNKNHPGFKRKLICVAYPGIVKNIDNMIATLGGIEKLENAVANRTKRLELRFRPKDIYCKPAIADKEQNASLLIKVKVRDDNTITDDRCYQYEVVGVPYMTFNFNRHADFQYLPLVTDKKETPETNLEYLLDELFPFSISTYPEALIKGTTKITPFLPPRTFLRSDFIVNKLHFERVDFYEGHYKTELAKSIKEQAEKRKLMEKVNVKKKTHNIFFRFKDKNVPTGPPENILNAIRDKSISPARYANIKELFDKRPIWSKIALQYKLNLSTELIKMLLPTVAYYHYTGPWRIMWVKYGYDPRTDPDARKYQTFDFRLRTLGGIKFLISPKRYKPDHEIDFKNLKNVSKKSNLDESFYVFKPNVLPPARQMFYQYCDLHLPKIQAMFTRLPTISPGIKCDSKNGWLPLSFSEQCREILCEHIISTVQTQFAPDSTQPSKNQEVVNNEASTSSAIQKSNNSLEDTFDLMEISDTDEDTDEESEEYVSSEEDEERDVSQSESEDKEIDMEIVEEVNQLINNYK